MMSLQDVMERIDALEAASTPLAAQVASLAKLCQEVHETTSGAVKALVQGELCSKLLKTLIKEPPQQQHRARDDDELVTLAQAWVSATEALELVYTWEEEDVVLSVLAFPQQVSGLLCASGLPQQPAGDNPSVQPSPLSSELQFVRWLWALGPAAVAAVVQLLHQFWQLTGINHLLLQQQQPQQPQGSSHAHLLNLPLLFLELHSSPTDGSGSSWCGGQSSRAAGQLLQLLYGGAAHAPLTVSAAMTAGEAFAGTCCLLQAAAVLHVSAAPAEAAAAARQPGKDAQSSTAPAWQVLAGQAGSFLRDSYGWCSFGEASTMTPAAAAAATEAARHAAAGFSTGSAQGLLRPGAVDSLYDCYMMQLLQQLLQGPSRSSSTTPSMLSGAAGAGQSGTAAAVDHQQAARALPDEAWEAWVDSAACSALAALVASYDRPHVLVRGLHTLTQQQLTVAENAAAAAATAAAEAATTADGPGAATAVPPGPTAASSDAHSRASRKKAEKAAMGRVLLLLDRVFLWHQHWRQLAQGSAGQEAATDKERSRSADAGGVSQLLLGLSELLRPAANCSVEWRCAALAAMLAAVEDFSQQHTGGGDDMELKLWCEASVEGLLYCARHDPSIQARRSAVQLLQHVALPSHSSTARALVCCLADKLSDKDRGVATAALQLFVQIEPKVLASCLTASQWCAAVQAALELVTSPGDDSKTSGREQLAQLLRSVLVAGAGAGGGGSGSTRGCVGAEGSAQVLLLLMAEPPLADAWGCLVGA